MILGAHLSTAKGLAATLQRARELECNCLQIFCKSPRQWAAPPLDREAAARFREAWREAGLAPLVAHDSYLINLASPDETLRLKSIDAMVDEVERAEALGCDVLVTHCGAHLQKDCLPVADAGAPGAPSLEAAVEMGLGYLAASVRAVLERTPQARVRIALENTAGQGTCLGGPFEHLAYVLHGLEGRIDSDRLAVCFDTCHAFAAGHDVSTAAGLEATLDNLDRAVSLERVAVIHLNDSKGELGRHLDRHEHIGQGRIGREAMARIVSDPRLRNRPFILETPEMETMDRMNLATARELWKEGVAGKA